jgi:hypothetical protein
MSNPVEALEIEDLPSFQKKEWRIQRIGWAVWVLILLAGMLGLVGMGPLSSTSATASDDTLTLEYDRFVRYHQPTKLHVMLRPNNQTGDPIRLSISQPLLDRLQISRIEPEPQRRELSNDGVVYSFPTASAVEQARIRFHVQYEAIGSSTGRIALLGRESVTFHQFVYP